MAKKKTATLKSKIIAKTKSKAPILKTSDLPVTQLMLTTLHKQIKSDVKSTEKHLESKINQVESKINQVESKINQVESKINQVESKINQVESKINQVESKIELVLSEVHRIAVLMEEQNSRNKFVLDGYDSIYQRQDRLEARFDAHEKNIEVLILKRNEAKEN